MSPAAKAPKSYVRFSTKLTGSVDQISKLIEDNAKLMDTVQELAIQLTHSIGALHSLTVRYAGVANSILDVLSPVLGHLPLIPKKAKDTMADLDRLTQRIIDGQASRSKTIADVQTGLTTGDVTRLQSHAGEIKSLTQSLLAVLPK
jgi:hypothetical protein